MSKKQIPANRVGPLKAKTASLTSGKTPRTRNEDGTIKPAAEQSRSLAPIAKGNGKPKTLQATVEAAKAVVLKIGDVSHEAASIAGAAAIYMLELNAYTAKPGESFPIGKLFQDGTQVGTVEPSGVVFDMAGNILNAEQAPAPVVPSGPAKESEQVQLDAPVAIELKANHLAALLAIAPTDDSRSFLNGIRLHQMDNGTIRLVATDGHRMILLAFENQPRVDWLAAGVTLPTEELVRIGKFIGSKDDVAMKLSFGKGHQFVKVTEPSGLATFEVKPIDGMYPDYQKVIDQGAANFTAERNSFEAAAVQAKYLASAGMIAKKLGAEAIVSYPGADEQAPTVFAFAGVPEAILYVSGFRTPAATMIAAPTVRLFGEDAMRAQIKVLQEQIKVSEGNVKKAKHEKFREASRAKIKRLQERVDAIKAALAPKLPAPVKGDETTPATDAPAIAAK